MICVSGFRVEWPYRSRNRLIRRKMQKGVALRSLPRFVLFASSLRATTKEDTKSCLATTSLVDAIVQIVG